MGILEDIKIIAEKIAALPIDDRVATLNNVRTILHSVSPFQSEPVDLVLWVKQSEVQANEYNPNAVAPPEMRLLEHSILENGYTQPIVAHREESYDVIVDGFHRSRVGRESELVRTRIHGYLPITRIRAERSDIGSRVASTIEHNRARGEHSVDLMSKLVRQLYEAGWNDERIQKELGMEIDEVIRLKQITGLAALFKDREFSEAWEAQI